MPTMFWIGLGLIFFGLMVMAAGQSRINIRNFRGNFAQRVKGSVRQTYTDAQGNAPAAHSTPSGEERFLKWAGLAIALGGFVVAIIKLLGG